MKFIKKTVRLLPILITVITIAIILNCFAFASNYNFEYKEFSEETSTKIASAVKANSSNLPTRYCEDLTYYNIAQFDDNYIVMYACDHVVIDTNYREIFGDYIIYLNGCGFACYSANKEKAISLNEAYETGAITENELALAIKYYNEADIVGMTLGTRIGDMNYDNEIDIIDLVNLRNSVINEAENYPELDVNKDGLIDIVDVVAMRDIIINGK